MLLDFTKMQSLGNDFVVLDGVSKNIQITPQTAQLLGDRNFGVGCDQILLAEPCNTADFRFRVFNNDGSEVEQCGNGARCFAKFLQVQNLTTQNRIIVKTVNTSMVLNINSDNSVMVEMGVPQFNPSSIPFNADKYALKYLLLLEKQMIEVSALAIGNPHAVTLVEDVDAAQVLTLGPMIESHTAFPLKANAGFMQVVKKNAIKLRVYERAVGETLGCGSGACAAVIAGIQLGLLDEQVTVSLPGGDVIVQWEGIGHPVFLTGSAHTVFTGQIEIPL